MEILLNGIHLDQLLESIGRLIEEKIGQKLHQPQKQNGGSLYISRKEVCKLLKISLPTLHEWTKAGLLQSYRIGSRVLYHSGEVETAVRERKYAKYKRGGSYGA